MEKALHCLKIIWDKIKKKTKKSIKETQEISSKMHQTNGYLINNKRQSLKRYGLVGEKC